MEVKMFFLLLIYINLLVVFVNADVKNSCANIKTSFVKLRKKRYLTFPPGTSIVLTPSVLKTMMVHAPSGWNIIGEIDVIYPLLSPEEMNALFRKKLHHRQKRELWETIEHALSSWNLNGRSCIFRSICEAKEHLAPPGKSLVHDILRAIFSAPVHDAEFKEEFHGVYTDLLEPDICEKIHDCPVSVIEFLLALNKNSL